MKNFSLAIWKLKKVAIVAMCSYNAWCVYFFFRLRLFLLISYSFILNECIFYYPQRIGWCSNKKRNIHNGFHQLFSTFLLVSQTRTRIIWSIGSSHLSIKLNYVKKMKKKQKNNDRHKKNVHHKRNLDRNHRIFTVWKILRKKRARCHWTMANKLHIFRISRIKESWKTYTHNTLLCNMLIESKAHWKSFLLTRTFSYIIDVYWWQESMGYATIIHALCI